MSRCVPSSFEDYKEGYADLEKIIEDFTSLMSTHEASHMTWTESSCSQSESSATSWKRFRSIRGHRRSRGKKERSHYASDTFSHFNQSEDRIEMLKSLVSVLEAVNGQIDELMAPRTEKEGKTGQNAEAQLTEFQTVNLPFLDEPAVTRMESHLISKRVQHLMGLPSTVLGSLRCFMPSAPSFALQKCQSEVCVLPRLEPLWFLPVGTKKNLERHLKKWIQRKHWKTPQRLQEALRGLKPPFPSKQETFPPAVHRQRSEGTRRVQTMQRTEAQAKLQACLAKKCLQERLDCFPAIVCSSKKAIMGKGRNWPLPKLIPPGRASVQPRKTLDLGLLGKGEVVEMNIKCKLLHFLWNLPTLYTQSLRRFCPKAPALPIPSFHRPGFTEGGPVEPSFLPLRDRKRLESHVLSKRLQHQWGLPGLAQRSLNAFLLSAPPSPAHREAKFHPRLQVLIVPDIRPVPCINSETQQTLERHLRRRILQRQWAIPKRVFESLPKCLPAAPLSSKTHKENRETYALAQERGNKKTPSSMRQGSPKRSAVCFGNHCPGLNCAQRWQQLEGHLAKKTLEVRLGMATPVVLRSFQMTFQASKRELPKGIQPASRALKPRSEHLLFVDQGSLTRIQLNITHKILSYRWGVPTLLNKSLAQLFHGTTPPAPTSHPRSKPAMLVFSEKETQFLPQESREALEWHVKRKAIHHAWGLPGIVQKSIQHLLPIPPLHPLQNRRYKEVAVSSATLTFLSRATKRELERNMRRRLIHHQWLLPKRVLEATKLLYGKDGFGPRRTEETWIRGAPHKQQSVKKTQRKTAQATPPVSLLQAKNQILLQSHLVKKCLEIRLEVFPLAIRTSRSCTFPFGRERLPKMILAGPL